MLYVYSHLWILKLFVTLIHTHFQLFQVTSCLAFFFLIENILHSDGRCRIGFLSGWNALDYFGIGNLENFRSKDFRHGATIIFNFSRTLAECFECIIIWDLG